MNENLNLVEILKDCPKGTKLYSPIFGDMQLLYIKSSKSSDLPIVLRGNRGVYGFWANGHYSEPDKGECVLFPSKDNRDWSTFKAPKIFKPYDRVIIRYSDNEEWKPTFYAYFLGDYDRHCMIGGEYAEDANILPYEGNEDKVGKVTD